MEIMRASRDLVDNEAKLNILFGNGFAGTPLPAHPFGVFHQLKREMCSFISRTAAVRPVKIARAMMVCPMFSSVR